MLKILNGVTQSVMMIFFQSLNAHSPKGRDEIYHSGEWIGHMEPYCKTEPGKDAGTVNFMIRVPEEQGVSLRVEGASLNYLEKCFSDGMSNGIFGFVGSKNALVAEKVLKSAEDEKKE